MKSLALVLLALPLAGLSQTAARTVVPVAPGADVQRALDAAPDGAETVIAQVFKGLEWHKTAESDMAY